MHIICLTPLEEGVYNDIKRDNISTPPDGWAVILHEGNPVPIEWQDKDIDYSLPSTFPRLGSIEAEELTYTREVGVQKTRYVPVLDNDGNPVLDECGEPITKPEPYTEKGQHEYKMMTVIRMTEGSPPEIVEPTAKPTQLDIIEAQVTYTAMMTNTLLEV